MSSALRGATPARHEELRPLGVRPTLPAYLRALWGRRDFACVLPQLQLRSRNGGTILGSVWTVLSPALLGFAFYLVFGVFLEARADVENYVLFLLVGVFVFSYSQACITSGSRSVTAHLSIIRTVSLPRAVFPLASTLTETLVFLPSLSVLFLVAVVTGERPALTWLLIPIAVLLQAVFSLGVAFAAARATFQLPDLRNLIPFTMRILLYFSGVFFTIDRLPEGAARTAFLANPLHTFISLYRQAFAIETFQLWYWLAAAGWAFVVCLAGLLFFWWRESSYGNR